MSIVAIPFAVSLEKVKSIFGSKDAGLLDKIKTADLYNHYADADHFGSDYNLEEKLHDIIFKYNPSEKKEHSGGLFSIFKSKPTTQSGLNSKSGYIYGYALLVVCDYLGTNLTPTSDTFCAGKDWETACKILKEKGVKIDLNRMFESNHPFDIPPIADFPGINCFSVAEAGEVYAAIQTIEINDQAADIESDDFDEVQHLLAAFRDSFKFCHENQLELISFAH